MNIQPPKEFTVREAMLDIDPMPKIGPREFVQSTYAYDAVEKLLRVKESVRKFGWELEVAYSTNPVADQTMLYPIDQHLDKEEWSMWMGKALIMIDEIYRALNIHHNLLAVALMGCPTLPKGARRVESMIGKVKDARRAGKETQTQV